MNINRRLQADLSFQQLLYLLMRLDVLLLRQVLRRRQADPDDEGAQNILQSYYVSHRRAYDLLYQPFGADGRSPTAQEEQALAAALDQAGEQIVAIRERAQQAGHRLRWQQLVGLFDLDPFEQDVLLLCLAPALDTRYQAIFGYLHDDMTRQRPSVNLILDVLCPTGPERLLYTPYFAPEAPLFNNYLLERLVDKNNSQPTLLDEPVAVDEAIVHWLLGCYRPNERLRHHLRFNTAPRPETILLPDEIETHLSQAAGTDAVVVFHGPDEVAQDAAAALLAATRERPLLSLNLTGVAQSDECPKCILQQLLRDALLTNAIPWITGWDSCLKGDMPPPHMLRVICQHPDTVIISGQQKWQPRRLARERRFFWLAFPLPNYGQRQALLAHFLNDAVSGSGRKLDLAGVAGQFTLTTGQLRDVAGSARDVALQNGRLLQDEDLFAAARAHSNPRLATLARKIEPRYDWEDLILPDDQLTTLHELVDTVRSRPLVLDQWGLGQKLVSSAGITVLFAGPPGTGKTMAAEVIASELGLDLYKIDLSSVVSKYIGETEKNLERIFHEAESSNAILFFDEADAIFGKRSEVRDAHDRYANVEISYLLQRMEAYDGVTILATNLRANLDDAFTRRLQFAIDFPFPERADRLRIWQSLFPGSVPREEDLDLERLARDFKLAGGNIRNILVSAAYLAATNGKVVSMEHLMHGTRRELQKMGRLVNEEDLEIL